MQRQDGSVTLETLAKQVLQYFIEPESGKTAHLQVTTILQAMCDELNDYYFFTKPYQIISGNSKAVEELCTFKEALNTIANKDTWSIEQSFSMVQKICKFLNKNEWPVYAVNNNFATALCAQVQAALQVEPQITKDDLQQLLQAKNGKIFTAELENALGKAITQHKKFIEEQAVAARLAMPGYANPYYAESQPVLFFTSIPVSSLFGLRHLASRVQFTLESLVEEGDYENEVHAHRWLLE